MEIDFHLWLRETLPRDERLRIGIGDDAAVVDWKSADHCVITSDLLADGVHFELQHDSPQRIGRKCLAANLSDIAAMAARPVAAVVSFLLPRNGTRRLAEQLYEGMLPLAMQFNTILAGGDTNSWAGGLAVNVTVFGTVTEAGPLRRDGAQLGDAVLVTGDLGGSRAGHHLDFTPRIDTALRLHQRYALHAGLDISDGLALDAWRLGQQSGCGIALDLESLPISTSARQMAAVDPRRTPLEHALGDGEDFELLLTVSEATAREIVREGCDGVPLTRIGTCVEPLGLWQFDSNGDLVPLAADGFVHGGN